LPRHPQFKPVKTANRFSPWRLNIPVHLSSTGRKQRLFFRTLKEAETAAEQIKTRQRNFGSTLEQLSPVRISEAAEAFKLLDASENKVSLLSLVKHHLHQEAKRNASLELSSLFQQYVDVKGSTTHHHRRKLLNCQARFAALAHKKITDLEHQDFEKILNKLTNSMHNAELRLLHSIFNFALKRGYLEKNPVKPLEFKNMVQSEVVTIPVETAEAVLVNALEYYPQILPYRILTIYAGIRPHEVQKMLWSDIHLEEKGVVVRAEVSKIRIRRSIDLSDNAVEWLKVAASAAPTSHIGPIVPFSYAVLRDTCVENWSAVCDTPYPKNSARHTFISCWLATHNNIDKVTLMAGHTSKVMFQKYLKGVTKAEAEKFWSIYPPKQGVL
jgi:integrase